MPCILTEDLAFDGFGNLDESGWLKSLSTYPPEMSASGAKDFISALNPQEPFEYAGLPPLGAVWVPRL